MGIDVMAAKAGRCPPQRESQHWILDRLQDTDWTHILHIRRTYIYYSQDRERKNKV
jgi:hypothetical protein